MLAAPVLRTFEQYLIAFCNLLEAASDTLSGVAVQYDSADVLVTFGDSRSNRFWDIWLPHFVTDERHRRIRKSFHKAKNVLPKIVDRLLLPSDLWEGVNTPGGWRVADKTLDG